jgi:hypothetical protein
MDSSLSTPVLFVVFNRPDVTKRVFDEIRKQRPRRLFVAADGPRPDRDDDILNCKNTRRIIEEGVDWDCELKLLFRKENLGCKYAVSSAITWFFDQVDAGIILEDDCLPDPSFFEFCTENLERYKSDEDVFIISGQSTIFDCAENFRVPAATNESYYFSKYPKIWGWATWKRVWQMYDAELSDITFAEIKPALEKIEVPYWSYIFDQLKKGNIDTWDYQLTYLMLMKRGMCISPYNNMISNIGFGLQATHTFDRQSHFANNPLQPLKQITHSAKKEVNKLADEYFFDKQIGGTKFKKPDNSLLARGIKKLKRIVKIPGRK